MANLNGTLSTAAIDKRIVEAVCSICYEVILAREVTGSLEEAELRDAIHRHTKQHHSLAKTE
jgi:hypothetical protein